MNQKKKNEKEDEKKSEDARSRKKRKKIKRANESADRITTMAENICAVCAICDMLLAMAFEESFGGGCSVLVYVLVKAVETFHARVFLQCSSRVSF